MARLIKCSKKGKIKDHVPIVDRRATDNLKAMTLGRLTASIWKEMREISPERILCRGL